MIPNGGPGSEKRLQLLHSPRVGQGNFSINRFVELVSTAPGGFSEWYPKKGVAAAGSDADLVLWIRWRTIRSARRRTISRDYSMFEGSGAGKRARCVFARRADCERRSLLESRGEASICGAEAPGGAWEISSLKLLASSCYACSCGRGSCDPRSKIRPLGHPRSNSNRRSFDSVALPFRRARSLRMTA